MCLVILLIVYIIGIIIIITDNLQFEGKKMGFSMYMLILSFLLLTFGNILIGNFGFSYFKVENFITDL